MTEKRKPKLASKFLVGAAVNFYGKPFCRKQIKLIHDGSLKKIKPPYVLVANHCNFVDVGAVMTMMYPTCASFVISVTQLVQWPKLINYMGILPKKQFTVDTSLIRDIKYVLSKNRPVVIYPEAKLSVVGTPNIIKPAIAKLIKMLKVPLVTVCFHGDYLHKPRWTKTKRFVPVTAEVKVAVTADEVGDITAQEIHRRIVENLTYDDYAYQLANGIEIVTPDLVEGLEHILYKCPECGEEFAMTAHGNTLTCSKCGAAVTQNKLGQLEGGRFDKVVDWYEWQRACVAEEVQGDAYSFDGFFRAEQLVGKEYVDMGDAHIVHNKSGITATFADREIHYKAGQFYTLSFNNDFVFLPTEDAVMRFKRQEKVGCTTKLNLAVEEQTAILEKNK
ncbi:MAG: hypothetical protein J1F66_05225 [Clostridiales bacterium]|nr:hypothetical protein [Clostridiales bacterium]